MDEIWINRASDVVVTRMKHIIEVQHMERMNTTMPIRKIDSDRYVELATGEIKEFEKAVNKAQSYVSLHKTFKKMRFLINHNFDGARNELHITLTYAENMTDTERLYFDFDKFMKRLRYKYRNTSTIDFMNVPEPQGRGAWHCHVLLRFNDLEEIFIPNGELRELWGHGFVKIKSLKDIDNIAAYLSAYLTDIEFNLDPTSEIDTKIILTAIKEEREIVEKEVEGAQKKFIKGGRLHMYPSEMNLIRKSKGIKYPPRTKEKYYKIKKEVGSAKPNFQRQYKIEKDNFTNTITFEQYNLKRK